MSEITIPMGSALLWMYRYCGWPKRWEWEAQTHHKTRESLERRGYVEQFDPKDTRDRTMSLTSKGMGACEGILLGVRCVIECRELVDAST